MSPGRQRWTGGLTLLLIGIAIWARDLGWTAQPADTLPLALGIPLAWRLGGPWQPAQQPFSILQRRLAGLATAGLAGGWLLGSLTLLAASWTGLVMLWSARSFAPQTRRGRLGWLLLLSFPWLVLEWQAIGWVFRLSSAAVAEGLFNLLQMPTQRQGTSLDVMGVPIEIEAACAGWNLLQLTLLTGMAFGAREIRSSRRFLMLFLLLPALVWLANLVRILILAVIALSFDTQLASGTIHGLTGLAVLASVLALTKALCRWLDPPTAVACRLIQIP